VDVLEGAIGAPLGGADVLEGAIGPLGGMDAWVGAIGSEEADDSGASPAHARHERSAPAGLRYLCFTGSPSECSDACNCARPPLSAS